MGLFFTTPKMKGVIFLKNFVIWDYDDSPTETDIDLDNLEGILRMEILVLSGDEILTVTYKDNTSARYDSSDCRTIGFYDGEYILYDAETGLNHLTDEYLAMDNSYDRMHCVGQELNPNMFEIYTGD